MLIKGVDARWGPTCTAECSREIFDCGGAKEWRRSDEYRGGGRTGREPASEMMFNSSTMVCVAFKIGFYISKKLIRHKQLPFGLFICPCATLVKRYTPTFLHFRSASTFIPLLPA